jgi:hypothetical protein
MVTVVCARRYNSFEEYTTHYLFYDLHDTFHSMSYSVDEEIKGVVAVAFYCCN